MIAVRMLLKSCATPPASWPDRLHLGRLRDLALELGLLAIVLEQEEDAGFAEVAQARDGQRDGLGRLVRQAHREVARHGGAAAVAANRVGDRRLVLLDDQVAREGGNAPCPRQARRRCGRPCCWSGSGRRDRPAQARAASGRAAPGGWPVRPCQRSRRSRTAARGQLAARAGIDRNVEQAQQRPGGALGEQGAPVRGRHPSAGLSSDCVSLPSSCA